MWIPVRWKLALCRRKCLQTLSLSGNKDLKLLHDDVVQSPVPDRRRAYALNNVSAWKEPTMKSRTFPSRRPIVLQREIGIEETLLFVDIEKSQVRRPGRGNLVQVDLCASINRDMSRPVLVLAFAKLERSALLEGDDPKRCQTRSDGGEVVWVPVGDLVPNGADGVCQSSLDVEEIEKDVGGHERRYREVGHEVVGRLLAQAVDEDAIRAGLVLLVLLLLLLLAECLGASCASCEWQLEYDCRGLFVGTDRLVFLEQRQQDRR